MLDPIRPDDFAADDPRAAVLPYAPPLTHQGLADIDPWSAGWRPLPASFSLEGVRPVTKRRGLFGLEAVAEALEVLALALFMFVAVRAVAQNFIVDGGSMEPNFHNGELVVVNKLAFRTFNLSWVPGLGVDAWKPFGTPEQGDVVVFEFPQDPTRDFIKRVIAVPGQTVEVREGVVFVDGQELEEPYLSEPPRYNYGPMMVPSGQLFVLGDNRNNSFDSHSWGMLPEESLIGRAEFRYWPLSEAGRISGHPHAVAEASPSP
jgi:signal peptidase I